MMNKQIGEEATFGGDGYVYGTDYGDGCIHSLQTQVVYINYVQLFISQSYLKVVLKKNKIKQSQGNWSKMQHPLGTFQRKNLDGSWV